MKTAPQPSAGCRHTLYHADQAGRPAGTWVDRGGRVSCGCCGRFYGYVRMVQPPRAAR